MQPNYKCFFPLAGDFQGPAPSSIDLGNGESIRLLDDYEAGSQAMLQEDGESVYDLEILEQVR